jgi:hypothetical protein
MNSVEETQAAEHSLPPEIEDAITRLDEASLEIDQWWYEAMNKEGSSPEQLEQDLLELAKALFWSDGIGCDYGCDDREIIRKVMKSEWARWRRGRRPMSSVFGLLEEASAMQRQQFLKDEKAA